MTTFEFFKQQYDEKHDYLVKCINPEIPVDSFRFVEVAWKWCFGGTTKVDRYYNIIGVDDTQQMRAEKMLKTWSESNWEARMTKTDLHVALTKKGLKAFYKAMF